MTIRLLVEALIVLVMRALLYPQSKAPHLFVYHCLTTATVVIVRSELPRGRIRS